VRVTHASHPLAGQIVRAVRQAGHPAFPEPQWVLELKDASRISIPLSWAELVEEPTGTPSTLEAERPTTGLLADAKGYLNLAKMVCHLKMNHSEEGQTHESPTCSVPKTISPTADPETRSSLSMGVAPRGTPARTGHHPGRDPDPAAPGHASERPGGIP